MSDKSPDSSLPSAPPKTAPEKTPKCALCATPLLCPSTDDGQHITLEKVHERLRNPDVAIETRHAHECVSSSRSRCIERGYCECECGAHWQSTTFAPDHAYLPTESPPSGASPEPVANMKSGDSPRTLIGGTIVPDSTALDDATEIIVDNLLWDYASFLDAPAESPSYDAASAQYDATRETLRQRVHSLISEAREEGPHIQRELVSKGITFDELLDFGRKQGVPSNDGYPWSFNYAGYPVTHENNDLYLITTRTATLRFNRGEMLHVAGDEIYVTPESDLKRTSAESDLKIASAASPSIQSSPPELTREEIRRMDYLRATLTASNAAAEDDEPFMCTVPLPKGGSAYYWGATPTEAIRKALADTTVDGLRRLSQSRVTKEKQ